MRGIQINNYFNNHISLNGKKINPDNPTTIVHTHRPQPLVIDHIHPSNSPEPIIITQTKSPNLKPQYASSNRKKRTNTIILTECKKQKKQKISLSLQHLKKAAHSAAKKKSNQSSAQKYQQKPMNSSYKKLKPSHSKIQKSQGLGKRSKSAIIRHPYQYSDNLNIKDVSSKNLKKQKKSVIIGTQSQSRKNSSKRLVKKTIQIDTSQSIKNKQSKISKIPSAIIKSKKNSQKIVSQLKLNKFQTQKKSARTNVSKSYHTSAKQSKPVSARDKKVKKKLFSKQKNPQNFEDFQILRDKFQNQLIKDNIGAQRQDEEVSNIVNQLQDVLTKLASKKSLKSQLKKITEKLKMISSNQPSQQQGESQGQNFEQDEQNNKFKKVKQFKPQQTSIKKSLKNSKHKIQFDDHKPKLQQKYSIEQSSPIIPRYEQQKEQDGSSDSYQKIYDQKQDDQGLNLQQKMELQQIDNKVIHQKLQNLKENNKYLEFLRQQAGSHAQPTPHEIIDNLEDQDEKSIKMKVDQKGEHNQEDVQEITNSIQDINAYLNNNQIIKQVGKKVQNINNYDSNNGQKTENPLLQRRPVKKDIIYNMIDEHEYSSIQSNTRQNQKSLQEKKKQIESLKQFMKQSNKMMEKLNKPQKKLTIQIKQTTSENNSKNKSKSPASIQHKYDDRYPNLIKSPKISDIQITNILSLKETFAVSKNSKMNQLIQKMYERQLVSPKSYEYSMYQLKKQFEQESQFLDGFKKHAEQFSQILNEIRKDKDDIKDIEQLLKNQKWEQARNYMKENNVKGVKSFKKKQNALEIEAKLKQTKEQDQQGWEKVVVLHQEQQKKVQVSENISPQRQRIGVVQSNINLKIQPTSKPVSKELTKGLQNQKQPIMQKYDIKKFHKMNKNKSEQSQESQHLLNDSNDSNGIVKKLDFQIGPEHHLRRTSDEPLVIMNRQTKLVQPNALQKSNNLQDEADQYMSNEKVDDLDQFEDYVYYQGEDSQCNSLTENKSGLSSHDQKNLKQEGLFKLIQIDPKKQPIEQQTDEALAVYSLQNDQEEINYPSNISKQSKQSVIHIVADEDDDLLPNLQQKSSIIQKKKASDQVLDVSQPEPPLEDQQTDSVIQLSLKKGFQSNLFFIKQYCISLCEYVRDHDHIKQEFKENIQRPAQFQLKELLKQYRTTIDGEYNNEYNSMRNDLIYYKNYRKIKEKAISSELAHQFNKTYQPLKYYNLDLNQKGKGKFRLEKQTQTIFLNAICQVLNETLDIQRPGGIHGKPLPWAHDSKHLKNMKYLKNDQQKRRIDLDSEAQTYDFIFGTAISRIIQWGSILCGFLPDTAQLQNTQIDEQYVTHIRQSRMAFILQKMLAQQQATINNSQLEEGQVLLSLSRMIMLQLFEQAANDINIITK